MPVASDMPMIKAVIIEVPTEKHPQGVRGVGEVPIVPPQDFSNMPRGGKRPGSGRKKGGTNNVKQAILGAFNALSASVPVCGRS